MKMKTWDPVRHTYFSCSFHFRYYLFNRWSYDDPIGGSKVAVSCNKSPFVVFDGIFSYVLYLVENTNYRSPQMI
jgi:hypothetical protein